MLSLYIQFCDIFQIDWILSMSEPPKSNNDASSVMSSLQQELMASIMAGIHQLLQQMPSLNLPQPKQQSLPKLLIPSPKTAIQTDSEESQVGAPPIKSSQPLITGKTKLLTPEEAFSYLKSGATYSDNWQRVVVERYIFINLRVR